MNKKGGEGISTLGMLGAAILFLLLIILGYKIIYNSNGAISETDVYLSTSDFDGDGTNDALDACPCGSDNVKQEISGKEWCLAGVTKEQCDCYNSFANSAMKDDLNKKYTQETLFKWEETSGKCLYMKSTGCKYVLYAESNKIKNTVGLSTCTVLP